MNKDTLERLHETVHVPHGDPQLVLYTKLVVGLLWLVHLPLGFLYGAPLPFYLLLGGMMLLDGVNLFLSRRSASRARELGAALAFLVGSALLFQKAYVGYFSWFFLLIFSFSCTFALGLVDGTFINLLSFLWVMACLRGGLIPDPAALYGESFVRRFPFLYICILGVAYIIMFSIQRYWVDKAKRHLLLQQRIDYLPMWEMYGDHARGCCLVIDWKASKWMEEEAEPVLYHVCYLRKQGNSYVVLNEDNEKLSRSCRAINSQLQELHNVAEEIAEQDRRYLDDVLGKVLYLFKDSSYSYEQELRVIYQTEENILHTKPKDPKDKPWLFVQTPFPLELDEVILGPKFPDVSTRVPYLQEQIYEMCDETDTTRPRITLSEINYR